MALFWLRVEAQNLYSFILDTQDLSTGRGGSLALLDIIDIVDREGRARAQRWTVVTTGASIGVWQFEANSPQSAEMIAQNMRLIVSQGSRGPLDASTPTRHATFRIVVLPVSPTEAPGSSEAEAFLRDRRALDAVVRRRQLSSARLVYPFTDESSGRRVCCIDLVRPAAPGSNLRIGGEQMPVSRSVKDRRIYGVRAKQEFYARLFLKSENPLFSNLSAELRLLLEDKGADPFALQLRSISEFALPNEDHSNHCLRPALQGKICIIYMDGNAFGALQDDYVQTGNDTPLKRQRDFDEIVKRRRRDLLADILTKLLQGDLPARGAPSLDEEELRSDVSRPAPSKGVVRFETLLWGGDEMMFAVPARFGWDIAELICRVTRDWRIQVGGQERPMHHAIGLVFCHDDAPISRIQSLARDLAEHAKDLDRQNTFVMPIVLESFDHIGDDLAAYLNRRAPRWRSEKVNGPELAERQLERDRTFALTFEELTSLRRLAKAAAGQEDGLAALPRRRLRMLARSVYAEDQSSRFSIDGLIKQAPAWLRDASTMGSTAPHASDFVALGRRERAFLLLEDHWDYLVPLLKTAGPEAEL